MSGEASLPWWSPVPHTVPSHTLELCFLGGHMHPHPLPQPLGRECRVLSLGFPACLLVSANLILDACILHLLPLPVQRKIWSVSLAFTGALPNMPLVGSLWVYGRWPSSRRRQGIILARHSTVHSCGPDHLSLKSLL